MNPALYYALQFILGGATIVGITLVAKFSNPKYTGIIYAFPVILILSMILIYLDNSTEVARKAIKSVVVYELTLFYFAIAFYYLLSRVNFWSAIILTLITWIILALIIQFFLK